MTLPEIAAAIGFGPGVETEGHAIAADIGFAHDDRGVVGALACRPDGVVDEAEFVHARDVRSLVCVADPLFRGDGLDAGEIGVQVERVNVIAELVAVDVAGGRDQALHPMQHLFVGRHALLDAADRLAQH